MLDIFLVSRVDARERWPIIVIVDEVAHGISIAFRRIQFDPTVGFVDLHNLRNGEKIL